MSVRAMTRLGLLGGGAECGVLLLSLRLADRLKATQR
jgi:hypothetical protein